MSSKTDLLIEKREFGADLVRVAGVCLLFWLHFFLRNGFYYIPVNDFGSFLANMFRPIFLCCVPLFAMLTGYLKCGKKWSKGYYKSLLPIIISWILISIVHLLYKIFYLHMSKPFGFWIDQFFGFKLADYSWYVGMYVGLFLLSPLINLAWNAVKTKKGHIGIVLTFVAVTFLTSTVNSITSGAGFENNFLPAYFTQLYYLTYYVIGCYIRTYRPKINRIACIVIVLAISAIHTVINMVTRAEADSFYSGYSASYSNLIIAVMTTLIFIFFYQFDCRKPVIRKIAFRISSVVLEMYLISYIFDSNIYHQFRGEYSPLSYTWVGLLMTFAVFVLSFVAGTLIHWLSTLITKLLTRRKSNA